MFNGQLVATYANEYVGVKMTKRKGIIGKPSKMFNGLNIRKLAACR
jgi:hypothetical protein